MSRCSAIEHVAHAAALLRFEASSGLLLGADVSLIKEAVKAALTDDDSAA